MDIVNILVALIVAAIVYVVAATFLSPPIPLLLALLVLVLGIFGGFGSRLR
jgi:uncharacterized membrane protein YccC